jgi:acetyltransferase-like isoleucine patch superfamily enzyme
VLVHPSGICESDQVGDGTRIWAFAHVLPGARIGRDCNICDGVFIENDVILGDEVTVKSGVQLWDGVRLGHKVFVGPNATFTNDEFPRSKRRKKPAETTVEDHVSIGANATILPGIRIGFGAMIGAGAVVLNDVPARAVVAGNPARVVGYAGAEGAVVTRCEPLTGGDLGARLVRLRKHGGERGRLLVAEHRDLPFVPKRLFLVDQVAHGTARGSHAHRACKQVLIAVAGELKVVVDDGKNACVTALNNPGLGLYIPPLVWSMQFGHTRDTVLLVLASEPYDREDYITDYAQFLQLIAHSSQSFAVAGE